MPSSARTRISDSRSRSRCRASTAGCSTRAGPGPIPRNMIGPRPSWSTCSSRISCNSRTKWMRACAKPLPRPGDNKPSQARLKPHPHNGPVADRALPRRTRSMTEFRPRLFVSDAEIEHLGAGLLDCTLRREEWTHEAHLAATAYLVLRRPEIDLDSALGGIIRRHNESVGGVNSDTEGYHESITRAFLHGVRLFLGKAGGRGSLHALVN